MVPGVACVGKNRRVNGPEEERHCPHATLRPEDRQPLIDVGDGRVGPDKGVRLESAQQPDGIAAEIKAARGRTVARRAEDASRAFIAPCRGPGGSQGKRGMPWTEMKVCPAVERR